VPHMPRMPAGEIRNPIAALILMEVYDALFQA
jgi:hypothetical protein